MIQSTEGEKKTIQEQMSHHLFEYTRINKGNFRRHHIPIQLLKNIGRF